MFVRELKNRIRLMPKECAVQVSIPGMPTGQSAPPGQMLQPHEVHVYSICKAHHHGQDTDYVDDQQPVELFPYDDGHNDAMTVGELLDQIDRYPDESLVRVAVPQDGHHRIVDIVTVGFGGDPGSDDTPPCELTTEFWQTQAAIIRLDHPTAQQGDGDWSYAQEHAVQRHPETGEIIALPQGEVRRMNVRGHPDGDFDVGKEGDSLTEVKEQSRRRTRG